MLAIVAGNGCAFFLPYRQLLIYGVYSFLCVRTETSLIVLTRISIAKHTTEKKTCWYEMTISSGSYLGSSYVLYTHTHTQKFYAHFRYTQTHANGKQYCV